MLIFHNVYLITDSSSDDEQMKAFLALLENFTGAESVSDSTSESVSDSESTWDSSSESKIATLMDMGFPRQGCIEALQENSRYKNISDIFPSKTFILSKS